MVSSVSEYSYQGKRSEIHFYPETNGLLATIKTRRLYLRSLHRHDLSECIKLFQDTEVMQKIGSGKTIPEKRAKELLFKWVKPWKENNAFSLFAVFKEADEEFLGLAALEKTSASPEEGAVELWGLGHKEYWNQGYGTEAAVALVADYALAALKAGFLVEGKPLQKILATARPDNTASCKMIENVGFLFSHRAEKHGAQRNFYWLTLQKPNRFFCPCPSKCVILFCSVIVFSLSLYFMTKKSTLFAAL